MLRRQPFPRLEVKRWLHPTQLGHWPLFGSSANFPVFPVPLLVDKVYIGWSWKSWRICSFSVSIILEKSELRQSRCERGFLPARILEHIAHDCVWNTAVMVAHANVGPPHLIPLRYFSYTVDKFVFTLKIYTNLENKKAMPSCWTF